jgi:nitric oxide reductase subunit B
MEAQSNVWFVQGIVMRLIFGFVFAAGYIVLMYDLLTIGKKRGATENLKANLAGGSA